MCTSICLPEGNAYGYWRMISEATRVCMDHRMGKIHWGIILLLVYFSNTTVKYSIHYIVVIILKKWFYYTETDLLDESLH